MKTQKLAVIMFLTLIIVSVNVSVQAVSSQCDSFGSENETGQCCPCECAGTIMRPDPETLHEWIELHNNASKAYIDPEIEAQIQASPGTSLSLLPHLNYIPAERDQGTCGNCWVWAGTGVLEIALDVQEGIFDRLSIQYLNSKYNGGTGPNWACCGGWLQHLANFYASEGFVIPWSNTNAAWADGTQTCADEATTVPWETISTSPNYPITTCTSTRIDTFDVGQAAAIANIKNVLHQDKALWFGYFLATSADWDNFQNFWWTQPESAVWNPDYSCRHVWDEGGGGHAVLCVGYDDTDPGNSYWIMVNSWGTAGGNRPNGMFLLDMDMNYDCYYEDPDGLWYSLYWETLDVTFAANSPPSVDDVLVWGYPGGRLDPGGQILLGQSVRLYTFVSDVEDPAQDLSVEISYRPQGGSWTTQAASWQSYYGYWYNDWDIPLDADLGPYDVKVDVTDTGAVSDSRTDIGEFEVVGEANNPPSVDDVLVWGYPGDRLDPGGQILLGQSVRLYTFVSDVEDPAQDLSVEISFRVQGGLWTTQAASWQSYYGYWYIDWDIPLDADLGYYDVKVEVTDLNCCTAIEISYKDFEVSV